MTSPIYVFILKYNPKTEMNPSFSNLFYEIPWKTPNFDCGMRVFLCIVCVCVPQTLEYG